MRIDIITIFPDYFAPLDLSLIGKARRAGLIDVRLHDLRRWTYDRHHTVDDTPYGGGPGMVMKPEPWGEALDAVTADADGAVPRLILPTPSGRPFTQRDAVRLAEEPWLVFACGRYEGIDARVAVDAARRMPVEEISIGDYVLNGGEVATLVVVEAVSRLLPGVLGNAESAAQDSFSPGTMDHLVEGPVYTKPAVWRGHEVPPVLLSGHHGAVDRWRRDEALRKTARNRPDLIDRLDPDQLDKRDREVLAEVRLQDTPQPVAD
ncbi:tRNA (guanosine(37)-N1)-methyltransferase TrmD [Thermobifida cellulosilytica]|uniref:tRNA (guanine-N(1)-)-methyltransferase n=1 Tax=Thermobifida cellulosilytica TB100 TaxID=665004 RepID=A0A147KGD8_THECS|nr:tRNA (guanosine(37)-N1)-methyltransferase TrmD [Thermobifida cellulosilytica]KUP96322.1 tRNA (guanine-N1)-methyltransferase [Thermobifida cellulosilytica TB100]